MPLSTRVIRAQALLAAPSVLGLVTACEDHSNELDVTGRQVCGMVPHDVVEKALHVNVAQHHGDDSKSSFGGICIYELKQHNEYHADEVETTVDLVSPTDPDADAKKTVDTEFTDLDHKPVMHKKVAGNNLLVVVGQVDGKRRMVKVESNINATVDGLSQIARAILDN